MPFSSSPLLVEAKNLYLRPLLDKYEKKEDLVYEDLINAFQAADAMIRAKEESEATAAALTALLTLHKSQVAKYREAALEALKTWTASWELPAPGKKETVSAFTGRCVAAAELDRPKWRLGTGLLEKIVKKGIQERAAQAHATAATETTTSATSNAETAPAENDSASAPKESDENSETDEPMAATEEGEEAEEGEEVEEGEEEAATTKKTPNKRTTTRRVTRGNSKIPPAKGGKAPTKAYLRGRGRGARSRGGGNAGK